MAGNAAYDGIKDILGSCWAKLSPVEHDAIQLRAELENILQEHQDINDRLQNFYSQSQNNTHIETVKGVGVNYGVVNQNNGVTPEFIEKIIAPFNRTIQHLENELKRSIPPEKQQQLHNELAECKQQLASKEEEIVRLQQLLAQSNGEILKEAQRILNTQGLVAALTYLQSPEHTQQENRVAAQMLELADKYQFEANLLQLNNQYAEAKIAYESMLKYDRSVNRLLVFAHYLQKQNEFVAATTHYEEALILYRKLAASNPSLYEPDMAIALHDLTALYGQQNKIVQAQAACDEALDLRRKLAASNPSVYEPDVAETLNNLAMLYRDQNQMAKAQAAYDEALGLRRELAASNPSVYEPDVAGTLSNLAILYGQQNKIVQSQAAYDEALILYRKFAVNNPSVYEPNVAVTLNNLVILYGQQNKIVQAQVAYDEALGLRRKLAVSNPSVYGIDLAHSLVMGVCLLGQPQHFLTEAKTILLEFERIPQAQKLLGVIKQLTQSN